MAKLQTLCCIFSILLIPVYTRLNGTRSAATKGICDEEEVGHFGTLNGLFYSFYESAQDPLNDPVVFWLSGGPGCSGLVASFFENGPCRITEQSSTASPNPQSWTKVANIVYIDQPRGTGFSPAPPGIFQKWHESNAIDRLHQFLLDFFEKHPEFSTQPIFLFGESYAGHYVPDLATEIITHHGSPLANRLSGIGIGNGLISPKALFSTILDMALTNSYHTHFDLLDAETQAKLRASVPDCIKEIDECQNDAIACHYLYNCEDIQGTVMRAARKEGLNLYNINKRCHEDPSNTCYRLENVSKFVNSASTQKALGFHARKHWEVCSSSVFAELVQRDFYRESDYEIPRLLESGVRVLIYAGDADLVCSWKGQDKWTRDLEWEHQNEFQAREMSQWGSDGECRAYKNFTFLRLFNCGHVS